MYCFFSDAGFFWGGRFYWSLNFELRALHLLGRLSTTCTPPALWLIVEQSLHILNTIPLLDTVGL
jgi:hypothetical protein